MPKNPVRDVRHSVYTNQAIRKPGASAVVSSLPRRLVPFLPAPAGAREFGLAYAKILGFEEQAMQYLEKAQQHDAEVLLQLAYLYDSRETSRRLVWSENSSCRFLSAISGQRRVRGHRQVVLGRTWSRHLGRSFR